jgi:WD40 repeat protein
MRPICSCLLLITLVLCAGEGVPAAAAPAQPWVGAFADPLPNWAIARLGTSRFRLATARQAVALAPDGKTLAVLGPEREQVVLLDVATGREIGRIAAGARDGLAFLRDGKELMCANEGTITFWDVARSKELRRVSVKADGKEFAAVSADGSLLSAGGRTTARKMALSVYEVQTGRHLATLEPAATPAHAALSPDGRWLATWAGGSEGGRGKGKGGPREGSTRGNSVVQVWDSAAGKELRKIDAATGEAIAGVAFAPDRKTLALATSGGALQVWDVSSGKRLKSWRGAIRPSPSRECVLAFSPDGKTLVLGARGVDAPPLAWDLSTGRRLRSAPAPECRFQAVGFPGGGRVLALGVQAQAVVVWDLLSGKRLGPDTGHSSAISALSFRADGRRVYTAAVDGGLIEWDLAGKEVRRLAAPRTVGFGPPGFSRRLTSTILEGYFSPGGAYLASSGRTGLTVRDVPTGQDVLTLPSATRSGWSWVAFSRSGLLAVPFADARKAGVRLFRMETGEELATHETESAPTALAFDPSGRRLAVGTCPAETGDDNQGEVRIYRTDLKGEDPDFVPFNLPGSLGVIMSLGFSHDGKFVLVARGRCFHLLDARTGREVDLLDVNEDLTAAPAFSPDGRTVAVASSREDRTGHTLSLLEVASGKKRWSAGVPAEVTALAFAPSGKVLATGHGDSSGMLWDVSGQRTGRPAARLASRADDLWADLLGEPQKAFAAQRTLAASGDDGVAVLRKRLRPAAGKPADDATLARLVARLDHDEFAVRRQAFTALAEEGKSAESALRRALAGKPSAEVKRQVKALLARLGRIGVSGDPLRGLRALEVLEWVGTPAARQLVEEVSRGRADAPLTREAAATLGRMTKK